MGRALGVALVSLACALRIGGFVGFTHLSRGGHWVHPWSLGSVASAVGVVGSCQGRLIHSCMTWGSLGSSGVVGFIGTGPGGL